MLFIEEYFYSLSRIVCCNKDEDVIEENDKERQGSDNKRCKRIKNDKLCKKILILPKNANANTNANANANEYLHCIYDDIGNDIDSIGIDIDDDIVKIKKELEESMSFKYHSDLHKSPRNPV